MITYQNFVKELSRFVEEAKSLRESKEMHNDDVFRKWRNALDGTLNQIAQADYLLPCPIQIRGRSFGYSRRIMTDEDLFSLYQREMDDTINELEFVIDSYKKHGEPQKVRGQKGELEYPNKVTLSWLFHHAPIKLWLTIGSLLIAAFLIGAQVGSSKIYDRVIDTFSSPNDEHQK